MGDIVELKKVREEKEAKLKEYGFNTRPDSFKYTHSLKEVMALEPGTKNVSVAGRVMSKRKMGKISFIDLRDVEGRIQLCMKRDDLGEELYKKIHETLDVGDFIGVTGDIFITGSGEKTVQVYKYTFLGKALRPLPEKFHGITNRETLYRERHLDLIMNDETKKDFF